MAQNYYISVIQNPVNDDKPDKGLPLHHAVSQNDMVRIRECIHNGVDVNEVDDEGDTALFYGPSLEAAKFLIDNGADVNIQNKRGYTAVVYLYQLNRESMKYLIPITDLDLMGNHILSNTLLGWMIVFEERDLSLIKLVISKTKNLHKLDWNGDSYLIVAAMTQKSKDVILLLIEAGCDPYIKDREGKNFYDLSSKYVKKEIKKNYPEFMYCKDLTDQQILLRQRKQKLKHLKS